MKTHAIYLSLGVIPWLGMKEVLQFAKECGFDGIDILPTRIVTKELEDQFDYSMDQFRGVATAHQSWRLDRGQDKKYGIDFMTGIFYSMLRYVFFPSLEKSGKTLTQISNRCNLPVTVHNISHPWVNDEYGNEFSGGINLEILDAKTITKSQLKNWLKAKNHAMVVDTRDDQSLRWATSHGFKNYKDFWTWIGLTKIHSVQLTLIGAKGMREIFDHEESLAQKELAWLYQMKWKGSVIVEVNPFTLLLQSRGNIKKGLKEIVLFIKTTLRSHS